LKDTFDVHGDDSDAVVVEDVAAFDMTMTTLEDVVVMSSLWIKTAEEAQEDVEPDELELDDASSWCSKT
jgi:hypothetical protein